MLPCNPTQLLAQDKTPPTANARAAAELIAEGNKLLTEKKYDQALDAYERAQKQLPRSAEIAYNRGIALYRLGKFPEAESAFQDALSTSDINLEASTKFNLGRAAHEQAMTRGQDMKNAVNDLTRAAGFYKDALQIRPDDAATRRNLDLAQKLQGYLEKLIALQKEQEQQKGPSSQPSDGEENPESQPSDEQQQGENQQSDQEPGEQSQQDSQEGEQQESQEQQSQQQQSKDQQSTTQNAEQEPSEQPEEKKEEEKEQEKPPTSQPAEKEDATSQPAEQAEAQPATSQPDDADAAGDDEMEMKDLTQEQAMQMLQEARDAERQRREMQRRIKLRQQGQSPVDKDW